MNVQSKLLNMPQLFFQTVVLDSVSQFLAILSELFSLITETHKILCCCSESDSRNPSMQGKSEENQVEDGVSMQQGATSKRYKK